MSKDREIADKLFGQESPSMGAMEAMGEGIKAALEGFGDGVQMIGDVLYGDGMQHFFEHGAHEIANALFNGSAYVMYPRAEHDNGVQQEVEQPQVSQDGIEP